MYKLVTTSSQKDSTQFAGKRNLSHKILLFNFSWQYMVPGCQEGDGVHSCCASRSRAAICIPTQGGRPTLTNTNTKIQKYKYKDKYKEKYICIPTQGGRNPTLPLHWHWVATYLYIFRSYGDDKYKYKDKYKEKYICIPAPNYLWHTIKIACPSLKNA